MITVWRIPLASAHGLRDGQLRTLDEYESRRVLRFVDAEQGRRWACAHVALREILGAALGVAPADIRFAREANGRPRLDYTTEVRFSLSHAAELAVVAVGPADALGVDLEQERPLPGVADVLRDVFTPREQQAIAALHPSTAHLAFLRGWTRKEAVVKALGCGIESMGKVEVTFDTITPRLVALHIGAEQASEWSLADLHLDLPFVGALAVRGHSAHYEMRDWTIS